MGKALVIAVVLLVAVTGVCLYATKDVTVPAKLEYLEGNDLSVVSKYTVDVDNPRNQIDHRWSAASYDSAAAWTTFSSDKPIKSVFVMARPLPDWCAHTGPDWCAYTDLMIEVYREGGFDICRKEWGGEHGLTNTTRCYNLLCNIPDANQVHVGGAGIEVYEVLAYSSRYSKPPEA